MGASTNAYLVYGVQLESGSFSLIGGYAKPEGSPENLAYTGGEYEGIKILRHCSDEFPEYIVCIARTVITATRGYPQVIHLDLKPVDGDCNRILAYCNKHGLKTVGEPSWTLCSYWG